MAKEKPVFKPRMGEPLSPLTDETGEALLMGDYISVMNKGGIGRTEYRIVSVTESKRAAVAIGEDFSSVQIPADNSMKKRIRRLDKPTKPFFKIYAD